MLPPTLPLLSAHYDEWKNSCVNDVLLNNVRSLAGDGVYEYLLSFSEAERRNDGRLTEKFLRQYAHCTDGGWWFASVSVRTGQANDYGCFKPDNPRESGENGKLIKYETPLNAGSQLFAFDVTKPIWDKISDHCGVDKGRSAHFYQWLFNNPQVPLVITEGAKKTGCLLSQGYAAIGLNGWTGLYSKEGFLHPDIAFLLENREKVYLVFDQDKDNSTRTMIHKGLRRFTYLVGESFPKVEVFKVTWQADQGKGVDDLVKAFGPDALHQAVKRAKKVKPLEFERVREKPERLDEKGDVPLKITYFNDGDISRKLQDYELQQFFDELGNRLEFDTFTSKIIFDGKPFQIESDVKFWFLREFGLRAASKEDLKDALINSAKRNSFNSVERYLKECVENSATRFNIDNLADRYFGRSEPIYNRMVKMWLVSAIARALTSPVIDHDNYEGSQVDHTLVLQSTQGKYKSTWFKTLGGRWFSDSLKDIENKDSLLLIHSTWILEFAELDHVTSRKQANTIKNFLTQRIDKFRKPYGHEVDDYPRRCVFCGTVNPSKFLVDDENRRFWIIPIADSVKELNIKLLEEERDQIWAAAYVAYKNGERWWPSDEEKVTIKLLNADFKESDDWEEPILRYLSSEPREAVSTYELLTQALGLQERDIRIQESRRVTRILDALGWTKESRREVGGQYRRVRLNPNLNGLCGRYGQSQSESDFQDYQISGSEAVEAVEKIPDSTRYQIPDPLLVETETQTQRGSDHMTTKNHYFPMCEKIIDDLHPGDRVYFRDNNKDIFIVINCYREDVTLKEWGDAKNRTLTAKKSDLTKVGGRNGKKS